MSSTSTATTFSLAPISKSSYQVKLEVVYGLAIFFIFVAAARIVALLCQIELNKAVFVDNKLELTEDEGDADGPENGGGGNANHVNASAIGRDDDDADGGIGVRGNHRLETEDPDCEVNNVRHVKSRSSRDGALSRRRRVPRSFVVAQMGTVAVLTLLIYVVLVASAAKWYFTLSATLSVMLVLLRYPIGEELRRNRHDRILRIASLVVLIAALLSTLTYVKKTLDRGEIYEGPARIVGYDSNSYGNAADDGVVRTDLSVSWGKEWGCPLTNGRVCQSQVKGALCEAKDEDAGDRRQRRRRFLASSSSAKASTATTNATAPAHVPANSTDLSSENDELKKENEELEEEVKELKKEKETEEENAEKQEKEDEVEETELVDEVMEAEDEEGVVYEEGVEDGIEEGAEAVEEGEDISSLEDEVQEDIDIETVENEDELSLDEKIEDIEQNAIDTNETVSKEEESIDEAEEEGLNKEDEDIEKVEEQHTTKKGQSQGNMNDDYYTEEFEGGEMEAEEIEEEEEEEEATPYAFEDDYYENEYWTYDWDSVWGEYGCQDLFDNDMSGQIFDDSQLPGEDDWPFLNIYGNCKTCEAYILDYFAEEAFEKVDHFRVQAIAYFGAFWVGICASFVMYLKHLTNPAAENTIELLSNDGGVIA